MNIRSTANAATKITETADLFGAKIPTKLRTDIDKLVELAGTIDTKQYVTATVAETVTAAFREGKDPLTDPRVHNAHLAAELGRLSGTGQLSETVLHQLRGVLSENVDTIIDAFKPAYNNAGQKYAEAHATLTERGLTAGFDAPGLVNYGRDIAAAAADGRQAEWNLADIKNAIVTLVATVERIPGSRYGMTSVWYNTGNARAEQLTKTPTYWEALHAGWSIQLHNLHEAENGIQSARQHEADDEAQRKYDSTKHLRALPEVAKTIKQRTE